MKRSVSANHVMTGFLIVCAMWVVFLLGLLAYSSPMKWVGVGLYVGTIAVALIIAKIVSVVRP